MSTRPAAGSAEDTAASLLQAEGIARHFGGVRAVDGVSVALAAGEFAALIGPNGAGKSTLFAVIAGQQRADAGSVRFAGRDITRMAPSQRARNAGEQFAAWRPLSGAHLEAAGRLLGRVGLDGQGDRAATDLAYADLKRLELAVALAAEPRLLLMDEPTAGMAAAERVALMDLVTAIAAESGLTVLFTEHSMDVVFGYARRLLVMSQGRLIADGAPDAVRAMPAVQQAYFGEAS